MKTIVSVIGKDSVGIISKVSSICAEHNVNIIVVKDKNADKSVQEELVEDMMSLIASFSGKLYAMRSKKNKIKEK